MQISVVPHKTNDIVDVCLRKLRYRNLHFNSLTTYKI